MERKQLEQAIKRKESEVRYAEAAVAFAEKRDWEAYLEFKERLLLPVEDA